MQEDKFTRLLLEAALCENPQEQEAILQEAYKLEDARLASMKHSEHQAQKQTIVHKQE